MALVNNGNEHLLIQGASRVVNLPERATLALVTLSLGGLALSCFSCHLRA